MRVSSVNAAGHRRMIIAKRNEEYKASIMEYIKNHGQASATQLKLHVKREPLGILLELVREGKLRRKRGFDAAGRVRILYLLSAKMRD